MKRDEYIETVVYKGHMVNVGIDDAGQQYFLEYVDKAGNLQEVGCGAYNVSYWDTLPIVCETPEECYGQLSIFTEFDEDELFPKHLRQKN